LFENVATGDVWGSTQSYTSLASGYESGLSPWSCIFQLCGINVGLRLGR